MDISTPPVLAPTTSGNDAPATLHGPALIAELEDLLQLDHDAIQSYALAHRTLDHEPYRQTVQRMRGDHERHVEELTALVRRHGGIPLELPHPTALAKLATQATGAVAGDRYTLIAFRANERQSRDKYARAARAAVAWPEDVRAVVERAADDEERHYEWVDETLRTLGVTDDSVLGRASRAAESVHARTADAIELVGKQGIRGAEVARRGVGQLLAHRPLVAAAAAVSAGVVAAVVLGGVRAVRGATRGWPRS